MKGVSDIKRKVAQKLTGQVDEAELMCRMLEAAGSLRRPAGTSATEALARMDPESREWLRRQARAALFYMMECLNAAEKPQ